MITAHLVIRNGNKYDYPWKEAILSILPAVEGMIVLEAYSEDDTLEDLEKLASQHKKIKIIRGDWSPKTPDEQRRPFLVLARLVNKCIAHIQTPWHLQIQGDEAFHEEQLEELKRLGTDLGTEYDSVSFPYTHFVANFSTTFPFMYQRLIRMARTSSQWQSIGDACQLAYGKGNTYKSDIMVYHYGKVHEPAVAMLKETDFQNMYTDLGFPDPKLKEMGENVDYYYLFQDAFDKGLFSLFNGTHPKVMDQRIEKAKEEGWEQFPENYKKS